MRVIRGKIKGRKFPNAKHLPVRPTTDFAKEGLFNYLENHIYIPEVRVLDLFAGIGNIGIEFLSRGAKEVWFVEQEKPQVKYIKDFINKTKLKDSNYTIFNQKVETFLKKEYPTPFDIVFLDPPYAYLKRLPIIMHLLNSDWTKENSLVILEHKSGEFFKNIPGFVETRKYGSSSFSIFKKESNP